MTKREMLEELRAATRKGAPYSALLALLNDRIDSEIMDAAGKELKIIANYAVGFDNIDLAAAKRRGIIVTNTPGNQISDTVAEHAFALILGLAKRISEADRFTRAHHYRGWAPKLLLGTDVRGKTLGIVGAGRIGSSLARHARLGFDMEILYSDPNRNMELEKKLGARKAAFEALLKKSDFVSLHVPLLPSTRHLMNARTIGLMKKTAFLINTSRGPVVSEKDLLQSLYKKKIAGAGLDVFECEPAIDCDLTDRMELNKLENVILTPHTASATVETRQFMSELAAKNIIAVLSGRKPISPAA